MDVDRFQWYAFAVASPSRLSDQARQRLATLLALGVIAMLMVGGWLMVFPPRGWTDLPEWEFHQVVPASRVLFRVEDVLPVVFLIPCVALASSPILVGAFVRSSGRRIAGLAVATGFHSIIWPLAIWSLSGLDAPLEPPANPGTLPSPADRSAISELVVIFDPWIRVVMPGLLLLFLPIGVGTGWLLHAIRSIRPVTLPSGAGPGSSAAGPLAP